MLVSVKWQQISHNFIYMCIYIYVCVCVCVCIILPSLLSLPPHPLTDPSPVELVACQTLGKCHFVNMVYFSLLIWCITLIDLHILKNPWIPGINPTWSCWGTCVFLNCGFLRVYNTLKGSYTMIKWDLSQRCKDSSICADQSMWYTILTNWKIKNNIILIDVEKAFLKIQHPFMTKKKLSRKLALKERTST